MNFKRIEDEFVIHVIRSLKQPSSEDIARQLFRDAFDWEYIHNFLYTHHLRTLFYEGVTRLRISNLPQNELNKLQVTTLANLNRNTRLAQETIALMDGFNARGIPVMAFKGVSLSQQLYNGWIQREIRDIDVLLHKADLERATAYLLEQGFVIGTQDLQDEDDNTADIDREYHLTMSRKESMLLIVELHWSLGRREFPKLRDPALFWNNPSAVVLNRRAIPVPTVDAFVIYWCMHGFKHGWARLSWIYDVAQFIHVYPDLDWNAILERANELNGKRIVLQGLFLAHDIFAAPLAEPVQRALDEQPQIAKISQQLESQIIVYPLSESPVDDFLMQYSMRQGWKDRLFFLQAKARPNENEFQLFPLGKRFRFVLYLIRAGRLLFRYVIPWAVSETNSQRSRV